jgi:hypothetical protein
VGLRAGLDVVTKRSPSLCWEWKPGRPSHSLVTILTELPRLLRIVRMDVYTLSHFVQIGSEHEFSYVKSYNMVVAVDQ